MKTGEILRKIKSIVHRILSKKFYFDGVSIAGWMILKENQSPAGIAFKSNWGILIARISYHHTNSGLTEPVRPL